MYLFLFLSLSLIYRYFGISSVVGVSEPFDPEKYPVLKNDYADFEIVIPKNDPFYVSMVFVCLHAFLWSN